MNVAEEAMAYIHMQVYVYQFELTRTACDLAKQYGREIVSVNDIADAACVINESRIGTPADLAKAVSMKEGK